MVDEPTTRRSFLFGRSIRAEEPWLRFLARLRRSCQGDVRPLADSGASRARLEPRRLEDVLHALALCREHGVCMALAGLPLTPAQAARPTLLVEAGRAWASLVPIGDGLWRIDAGCPVSVMQAAGVCLAPDCDPVENLAQYISMLRVPAQDAQLGACGVEAVECLYPDGSIEVLGQFGVHDSQPLRSLAAQRTIPALFQLAMRDDVQTMAQNHRWPLCYRLDALMDVSGQGVNLAHLFLGHRGSLGWLVAAHVRSTPPLQQNGHEATGAGDQGLPSSHMRAIELEIKRIMDPDGVFLPCPDQTG